MKKTLVFLKNTVKATNGLDSEDVATEEEGVGPTAGGAAMEGVVKKGRRVRWTGGEGASARVQRGARARAACAAALCGAAWRCAAPRRAGPRSTLNLASWKPSAGELIFSFHQNP